MYRTAVRFRSERGNGAELTTMNSQTIQPSPQILPIQAIGPMADGAVLPLAPPESRDDAPC